MTLEAMKNGETMEKRIVRDWFDGGDNGSLNSRTRVGIEF